MRLFSIFVNSLLLLSFPCAAVTPKVEVASSNTQHQEKDHCPTYDEMISYLEKIESGEIEQPSSLEELDRINLFLANLAREGALPNKHVENWILENDIQDLLDHDLPQFAFSSSAPSEYVILASSDDQYVVVPCGWISEKWEQTKKFCKKHKKVITIGVAVVVAVVVVAVVCVAALPAAAAAAGAAAAASDQDKSAPERKDPPPSQPENIPPVPPVTETPVLKEAIQEQVDSLKAQITEGQTLSQGSIQENARNFGSMLAHKTLEGVSELASVIPQLNDEIKEMGKRFLPESLQSESSSSVESYEELIAKGHEKIDQAFSTHQAECYSPGARGDDFAIGLIPPPAGISSIFYETNTLLEAGNALDRADFTRVGRALTKHGYRKETNFPKPVGNPAQVNRQGEAVLKEILTDPNRTILKNNKGDIEIYAPNGRGAYFRADGTFRGFIEYGHK